MHISKKITRAAAGRLVQTGRTSRSIGSIMKGSDFRWRPARSLFRPFISPVLSGFANTPSRRELAPAPTRGSPHLRSPILERALVDGSCKARGETFDELLLRQGQPR